MNSYKNVDLIQKNNLLGQFKEFGYIAKKSVERELIGINNKKNIIKK